MAMLTIDLPETPQAQPAYRLAADCPHCGAPLVLRQNRQTGALLRAAARIPAVPLRNPTTPACRPSARGWSRPSRRWRRRWSRPRRRPGARWQRRRRRVSGSGPPSGPRWTGPCGSSLPWRIPIAGRTRRWRIELTVALVALRQTLQPGAKRLPSAGR